MDKYDIFISYSRRDKTEVDAVVDLLTARGYSVWIDVDGIESGEAFRRTIVEAIEDSSIVLFFSSEASNRSKWTTKEISLAVEFSKYIIPIKLDSSRYNKSILFDLIDLDYIDLADRKAKDASIKKLLRTVRSKIGEREVEVENQVNESEIVSAATDKLNLQEQKRSSSTVNASGQNTPDTSKSISRGDFSLESFKDGVASFIKRLEGEDDRTNTIIGYFLFCAICGLIGMTVGSLLFPIKRSLPACICGWIAAVLLFFNRRDGIVFVAAACLLWTLANAYVCAPDAETMRFFQQGNPIMVWSPLIVLLLVSALLFVKKNGKTWWEVCRPMSTVGVILLTMTIFFWLWTIYFDTVTKFGLPTNLRHYVARIFG